jgi:hypothetical protein
VQPIITVVVLEGTVYTATNEASMLAFVFNLNVFAISISYIIQEQLP